MTTMSHELVLSAEYKEANKSCKIYLPEKHLHSNSERAKTK